MTSVNLSMSAVFLFFCLALPVYISISKFSNPTGEYLHPTESFEKGTPSGLPAPDHEWPSGPGAGAFDRQAEQLVRRMRMSRAAARDTAAVLDAVRRELGKLWTDFKLTPFGSAASGLALSSSSDVDAFVTFLPPTTNSTYNASALVLQSAQIFKQNTSYANILPLFHFSVPILRFLFTPTNQECDLSFRQYDDSGNTPLFKYMFRLDNRALNLMIIVKRWAKINKIHLSYFMTSVVWYKLVVFYLQQVHILPSVYDLQRETGNTSNATWNKAFEESYIYLYPSENTSSLYDIVGGFFEYFSNFNFERDCVSIFAGKPVARKLFESAETVPEEFSLYKYNVRNNISGPLNIDTPICVQRAFLHNNNAGHKVYPALLDQAKKNLRTAADLYRTKSERDFLSALLTEY